MEWVIDVASFVATVERRTIVAVQRRANAKAFGKIRIRDEHASEPNQIGVAFRHDLFRAFAREAARGNDSAVEDPAKVFGRHILVARVRVVLVAATRGSITCR